tara:strand:- start:155 stop:463 length:309 start_codon:yes stop_codon:yes gene_type:complete
MDMTPSDPVKVLKDLRELVKEHILPRLTQLEEEVRLLREVTWPVCQALREKSQLSDKSEFMRLLDDEEVVKLLKIKQEISKLQTPTYSTTQFLSEEILRCLT